MQLSRKLLAFAFLFVLLLAALPQQSTAQEDDVEVSEVDEPAKAGSASSGLAPEESDEYDEESEEVDVPLQQYVTPAQDVQTSVKFLGKDHTAPLKFTAGEEVVALIGLRNTGSTTYNVSYVGAHLHSPYDQNFYIQNYTVGFVAAKLPPHSEVTVQYKFRPADKLEALDYHLSGWLLYNDSAPTPIIYRSLFVNQTIEVVEARGEWTVGSVITWTASLAGLALGGYVLLQQQQAAAKKSAKKGRANATEGEAAPASSGWDVKVYKPAPVQKSVSKKRLQEPAKK